jgi:hypothetical protein
MASAFVSEAARLLAKPPEWCAPLTFEARKRYLTEGMSRLMTLAHSSGILLPSLTELSVERASPESESTSTPGA